MVEICQGALPHKPWRQDHTRRLPGLNPIAPGAWLIIDDAYGAQLAYKARLMAEKGGEVVQLAPEAEAAAGELLALVLRELKGKPGFEVQETHVTCPDGRRVMIDHDAPLQTCGQLVQEDLCIMQKQGDEHVLTGALLCFPASWSLAQKFMRPLIAIHDPVASYNADIARRVQRLFDGIQVDRPMWRANFLTYSDPDLFQPRRTQERRRVDPDAPKWMRVERQGLRKLPQTGAVIFSIHTYVVPFCDLSEDDIIAL